MNDLIAQLAKEVAALRAEVEKLKTQEGGSGYLLASGTRTGATSQAQTFTNGITVPSGGKVIVGTTSPITTANVHIVQPSTGAIVITNLETDATTKVGRVAVPHYTNAEESLLCVGGACTSTANNVDFGGGSGVLNTATQIQFWTATTTTTLTGSVRMKIDANGLVAVGSHTPTAHLHIAGNITASAWSTTGVALAVPGATFTDSSTAVSGTATNAVANGFGRPTFAASNTGVTMTNAATVYIANSPAAGTNVTLTNTYALWIDDGVSRFDGQVQTPASTTSAAGVRVPHGSAPTSPADGDLWTTTAGMFVRINGVTKTVTLT